MAIRTDIVGEARMTVDFESVTCDCGAVLDFDVTVGRAGDVDVTVEKHVCVQADEVEK